ncbi:MAG: hypothetical protein A2921_04740 [Candidatus Magasanikbacteria bacterium RIFCSPLOWO2_01_FULL_43_20b]|nr:MAG: hypothetical protein A3I93_01695 [Candidatus Magasanikbacteria bacterium RIFCSPLOWO2_02_FULL_43_22]OGH73090.1 MAG: hypothetical protein A2921_04740 [Candidatus Magasanikbacteria bacterium RIFCSPLOWO2_01_FULL_43_20b]
MNTINDILNQKADDLFGDDALFDLIPTPAAPDIKKSEIKTAPDLPVNNTEQIKIAIHRVKDQLDGILRLLNGEVIKSNEPTGIVSAQTLETGEKIIEGNFNGEKMIDNDGKEYGVPANYASKSKLVEGDLMKLTITKNGSFIFKQIGPVERRRVTGELIFNADSGQYTAIAEGKTYKVLTASITFFKGNHGDEVVLVVPRNSASAWGAVDNVI